MNSKTHRIQVGDIVCTVLADGFATYALDGLMGRFPDVGEDALRQSLAETGEDPNNLETAYNTLLIQTKERTILVDGGERADRHTTAGNTLACLQSIGVAAADVDTVVISHCHGDHVIGLFDVENNLPIYQQARVLVAENEWQFWTDPERNPATDILKQLDDKLSFIDYDAEIVEGIRPILLPGHTVGHTGVMVESKGERFLHAVDLVHAKMQFAHPERTIKFDTLPEQARQTRLDLFNRLADEQLTTLFYHMSFPGVGTVQRQGAGFAWSPSE